MPCADVDRIAAIGFCFGGMVSFPSILSLAFSSISLGKVVLDAVRSGMFEKLRVCASFHGSFSTASIVFFSYLTTFSGVLDGPKIFDSHSLGHSGKEGMTKVKVRPTLSISISSVLSDVERHS